MSIREMYFLYLFIYLFLRYRGLNPGVFYLRATPPALFVFILYFETGSHEVAEGLRRERDRERQRETERDRERQGERQRERELRLAANPDPLVSASQSTGITSVRHHARLTFFIFETGSH